MWSSNCKYSRANSLWTQSQSKEKQPQAEREAMGSVMNATLQILIRSSASQPPLTGWIYTKHRWCLLIMSLSALCRINPCRSRHDAADLFHALSDSVAEVMKMQCASASSAAALVHPYPGGRCDDRHQTHSSMTSTCFARNNNQEVINRSTWVQPAWQILNAIITRGCYGC